VPGLSLLFLLVIVMLECRLQAWLGRVLGIRRDFFPMVLFLLLNFFVVGNVAWVGHGNSLIGQMIQTPIDAMLAVSAWANFGVSSG
jgi:putative copper export protein